VLGRGLYRFRFGLWPGIAAAAQIRATVDRRPTSQRANEVKKTHCAASSFMTHLNFLLRAPE
jgi:hypothetical protein